jgi:murein DD-endopeptidase MepM/ murein hydrolase activator NlpD
MRYFVIILATIFITLSITIPEKEKIISNELNGKKIENDLENTNTYKQIISFDIETKKEFNLLEYKTLTEKEEERIWGAIGIKEWMLYKNIDGYIYIDGYMEPTKGFWEDGKFKLPENELESLFHAKKVKEKTYALDNQIKSKICRFGITEEEIIDKLKMAQMPIKNATITKEEGQLPGASRAYRNGYHEGFDWYSGAIGLEISKSTKVFPMFEGKIVRIDKAYQEMTQDERGKILEDEQTSENRKYQMHLDKLRGKQVWIQSENGVLIRYAHLEEVNKDLNIGELVDTETEIGATGNSGTSNGVLETNDDVHLHTDIVICGKNFWEYGDTREMNTKLIEMFEKE